MSSIADNIPPEILRDIFGHTETWFRQWHSEPNPLRQHNHIEQSGVLTRVPVILTTSSPFTNFRLVSRKWKRVADTLFFREVAINLGFSPDVGHMLGEDRQSTDAPGSRIKKLVL